MNPVTPTMLDLLRSAGTIAAVLGAAGALVALLISRRGSPPNDRGATEPSS